MARNGNEKKRAAHDGDARSTEATAPPPGRAEPLPPSGLDALWVASPGYRILKAQEEEGRRLRAAIEEAHRRRSDLGPEEFEILASHAVLSGDWDSAPAEILREVNALRPRRRRRPPGRRPGRPALDETEVLHRIDEALYTLAERDRRAGRSSTNRPSRAEIAYEIGIHVRTLNDWAGRFASARRKLP